MPDYTSRYDLRRLEVAGEVLPQGAGRAVDLGCLDGTVTAMIAARGFETTGYDINVAVVDRAREAHPELSFYEGSAREARAIMDRDLTVCLEVIEHLAYDQQRSFLEDIYDATRPGGRLVLSTPGRFSLLSLMERGRLLVRGERDYYWWDTSHVGVLSFRRLRNLLRQTGFVPEAWVGFCYLPVRLFRPFSIRRGPAVMMGFDLFVVATRP